MTVAHDWLSYMGPFEEVENPSVGKDCCARHTDSHTQSPVYKKLDE
jgi:hypothetical protein